MHDPNGTGGLPGFSTEQVQTSKKLLLHPEHKMVEGVRIVDTTVDDDNTPETKLRAGLVLVRVEEGVHAGMYVNADHYDAPAAGDIEKAVILLDYVNMLNRAGDAPEDKEAQGLIHGHVIEDEVIWGTDDAPTLAALRAAMANIIFS